MASPDWNQAMLDEALDGAVKAIMRDGTATDTAKAWITKVAQAQDSLDKAVKRAMVTAFPETPYERIGVSLIEYERTPPVRRLPLSGVEFQGWTGDE